MSTKITKSGEAHRHCWHPYKDLGKQFELVAWSFLRNGGTGFTQCRCCHCGEYKDRSWTVKRDLSHGKYWQVLVRAYEDADFTETVKAADRARHTTDARVRKSRRTKRP